MISIDLSRISYGKIQLQKEKTELTTIIQQALETNHPLIEDAGHKLQIDFPCFPLHVEADVSRLTQVFSNLLNNAIKYTEKGGLIRLSVQQCNNRVKVSVQDNGVGIPPHMLPFVFEKFTQVDQQLKRSQGGLGIGLSLVKQLVELHGGTVVVKSDGEHLGSEFIVNLPLIAQGENIKF